MAEVALRATRRRALLGGAALAGALALPARARAQLAPETPLTEASPLQRAILSATQAKQPYRLPPRIIRARGLVLPDGARLVGVAGKSELWLDRTGPLLSASHGARVSLVGIILDGGGIKLAEETGLVDFRDIAEVSLEGCTLRNAGSIALRLERCGGRVRDCRIEKAGRALFSLDAVGLVIDANSISDCADNGVQIWREAQGFDGTLIKGNAIANIRNVSGGTGQFGNGVSVFRAGGVTASGNTIRAVAYSALRNNSGRDVVFADNECRDCGETAIFAEFAFRDALIKGNTINGAVSGVQMVNFADAGGRGAQCVNNRIAGLRPAAQDGRQWGYGAAIKAEAGALVAANTIDGAPWIGVMAGWGPSLDDVRVEFNTIGPAPIGVGVSVAPGARRASVVGNTFAGAHAAVIAAMEWDRIVDGDLGADAGRKWPQLVVTGNKVG